MNYQELQQQVASYMHRTDLAIEIPGFIELARTRINRDLRVRAMLKQADTTPTVNPFPAPADFLEMRDMYRMQDTRRITLTLVGRKQLNDYVRASGAGPLFYSIDGDAIETAPDGVDTPMTQLYYAAEPALVDDTDENVTMERYPSIWLYGALIEGHTFTQDLSLVEQAVNNYTSEVQEANTKAAKAESGASLQMQGASNWN